MISGFILKKGSMSNIYQPDGSRLAITKCTALPLKVTQIKTTEKDGYQAVQVAYGSKKNQDKATASKISALKLNISPKSFKEFELTADSAPEIGTEINFDSVFNVGDEIKISGISKGRGFAGVIKRYGFQRQPVSGGQSDRVRAPGAIGAQTPGKVLKGKKMPGHYGNTSVSVTGLKIINFNPDTKEVLISGSIPGHSNSYLTVYKL